MGVSIVGGIIFSKLDFAKMSATSFKRIRTATIEALIFAEKKLLNITIRKNATTTCTSGARGIIKKCNWLKKFISLRIRRKMSRITFVMVFLFEIMPIFSIRQKQLNW